MAKISRYIGNLKSFAADATGQFRTVFGSTTQSDNLTDNVNNDYLLGWENTPADQSPAKQDFNAAFFTQGQLLAYLHQVGVAEWDSSQEYHAGSHAVASSGMLYRSNSNNNIGNDPAADGINWTASGGGIVWDLSQNSDFTAMISTAYLLDAVTMNTIAFPAAHSVGDTLQFMDSNDTLASGTVNFDGNGSLINGTATLQANVEQGFYSFVSDGTNWLLANTLPTLPKRTGIKNQAANGDLSLWQRLDAGISGTFGAGVGRGYLADRIYGVKTGSNPSATLTRIAGLKHEYGQRLISSIDDFIGQGIAIQGAEKFSGETVTVTMQVVVPAAATGSVIRAFDGQLAAALQTQAFTPTGALQEISATFSLGTHVDAQDSWGFDFRTNVLAGEAVELHEIQVEFGDRFTGFEPVIPALNEKRCGYHYEVIHASGLPTMLAAGYNQSAFDSRFVIGYAKKKSAPSIAVSSQNGFLVYDSAGSLISTGSILADTIKESTCRFFTNVAGGLSAGDGTQLSVNTGNYISFDSEYK